MIRVGIAGVTGWTGRAVAEAVESTDDLELVFGVARSDPARFSTVAEALDAVEADVLVDYTHAAVVAANVRAAVERGVGVVVGSSGTAREIAERLAEVRTPIVGVPLEDVLGAAEARGATIAGTQVHSLRLPGFVVSTEVLFAAPGERLTLRHDAGDSPAPYVAGTLLAIRAVPELVGLTRGLDRLLPG